MVEKALLIASKNDGPWVPVESLVSLVVDGMTDGDLIEVVFKENDDRVHIYTDGIHSMNLGAVTMRVCRLRGESRITVRAIES